MIIEVGNNKSKQEKKTMNDVVSKLYLETSKWFVTKSLQALKICWSHLRGK